MSVKISALPTSSLISSNDVFPVVDDSTLVTQKATAQQILNYITGSTFNTSTITILTGSTVTGSTALFTTITGTNVLSTNLTGTTALYTTITGTNVRSTTLTLSSLTGSGVSANMLVSGSFSSMVAALTSSSTTYTLTAADSGKLIVLSSSSGITASVPTGLPVGFTTTIVQNGSGSILVTGSVTSVVIRNRQGHLRTAGLYAAATLISTGSNGYIFSGDTTT